MEDDYLIVREYENRISDSISPIDKDFIQFQHTNGRYYFAWVKDGKIFLRSEGYASPSARDSGLQSVLKNRYDKNNYRTESAHGAHFLILLSGNNKEIARSFPMHEEIETFIALNNLESKESIATAQPQEENIQKDKLYVQELDKKGADIKEDIGNSSDTNINIALEEEPTSNAISENNEDNLESELTTKMISSPLLESFRNKTSIQDPGTEEKEEAISSLDDFELEEEDTIDANNEPLDNAGGDATMEQEAVNSEMESKDIEELTNALYTTDHEEPDSRLSKILAEEEKSNSGGWKWILGLILVLLLGAFSWWLFKMNGYDHVKKIVTKYAPKKAQYPKKADSAFARPAIIDSAALNAKSNWDKSLGAMVSLRLSDGSLITVPQNGIENKLVAYLEAKCGTSEIKKTWFDMDRILFKSGTDELLPVSDEQIVLLAKIFKSYPNKKFKIGGYTDNLGNPEDNIRLSASRAASALRAISAKGIDSARMRYEGYGQEHPICPENDTEECRAKNRRVAIRVDVCI